MRLKDALGEIQTNPKFLYAMMEGLAEAPQLRLLIDREKARALGVSFETISGTLSAAFGSEVINDFTNAGRQQRVVIQAEQGNRMTPESVLKLHVPNDSGSLVPLSAFVTTQWEEGPVQIARYNGYPAFRISGDAAPGVSTGEAMAEIERLVAQGPSAAERLVTGGDHIPDARIKNGTRRCRLTGCLAQDPINGRSAKRCCGFRSG